MKNSLLIKQLLLGELENFSYIVADKSTAEAFIVDPAAPLTVMLDAINKEALCLKGVLLTHGHYDHVVDVPRYDVPVYLSRAEAAFFTPKAKTFVRTHDGEKIPLGSFFVECIHTPGHAPGCQCFFVDGNLFTGDTLFVDAVGRTDLPGGSTEVLFESLKKIKGLSDDTVVWPGHHYGAVSYEKLSVLKKSNPFLACDDAEDFQDFL